MTTAVAQRDLLTRIEVAGMLGVSIGFVNLLRRSGELRPVYLTKRMPRYRRSDVEAFILQRQSAA